MKSTNLDLHRIVSGESQPRGDNTLGVGIIVPLSKSKRRVNKQDIIVIVRERGGIVGTRTDNCDAFNFD